MEKKCQTQIIILSLLQIFKVINRNYTSQSHNNFNVPYKINYISVLYSLLFFIYFCKSTQLYKIPQKLYSGVSFDDTYFLKFRAISTSCGISRVLYVNLG